MSAPERVSITAGEWRSDIAEDQRVVILSGLRINKPRIAAADWTELVFSGIGDPGLIAKEESLNSNDVNGTDSVVAIHVSSGQPASRERGSEIEEMPLGAYRVNSIDTCGTRCKGGLRRCDCIASARRKK